MTRRDTPLDWLPLLLPRSVMPVSLRIQVTLERAIALGMFPEGRLPSERRLSAVLNVSRTALRSALELVRRSGYAEQSLVGRTGGIPTSTVTPLSAEQLVDQAEAALVDITRLMDVRRFLEPACARAVALDRSGDRLERMVASQQKLSDHPSPLAHRLTDGEFHHELAWASGSEEIVGTLLRSRADLLRWRDRLPMEDTIQHSSDEHSAIIDAISAGDVEAAEAATVAHVDSTQQLYQIFLRRYVEAPEESWAQGQAAIARAFSFGSELLPGQIGPGNWGSMIGTVRNIP